MAEQKKRDVEDLFDALSDIDATKLFTRLEIIVAVKDEIARAEKKHPTWPEDEIYAVAIMAEEAGEAVKAALDYKMFQKESIDNLKTELIQVAAMAIRMLEHLPGPLPEATEEDAISKELSQITEREIEFLSDLPIAYHFTGWVKQSREQQDFISLLVEKHWVESQHDWIREQVNLQLAPEGDRILTIWKQAQERQRQKAKLDNVPSSLACSKCIGFYPLENQNQADLLSRLPISLDALHKQTKPGCFAGHVMKMGWVWVDQNNDGSTSAVLSSAGKKALKDWKEKHGQG